MAPARLLLRLQEKKAAMAAPPPIVHINQTIGAPANGISRTSCDATTPTVIESIRLSRL